MSKRAVLITDIPFWYHGIGQALRIKSLIFAIAEISRLSVYYLKKDGLSIPKEPPPSFDLIEINFNSPLAELFFIKELEESNADIVIIEYIHLHHYMQYFPSHTLKILDTHDISSRRSMQLIDRGVQLTFFMTETQEIQILQSFDYVIAIQEEEALILRNWIGEHRVITCPHPVAAKFVYDVDRPIDSIRFIGSPSIVNQDAIVWFHNEVLPLIEVDVQIWGTIALVDELRYKCPNYTFSGTVHNLAEFYSKAGLIINPVQFGTGLKIKSVEALGYGAPLIATKFGGEGINKDAFYEANTAEEFRDVIQALIDDPNRRKDLAIKGYEYASKAFNQHVCYAPLFSLFDYGH